MRVECERSLEHLSGGYVFFVYFGKAFDRVNWVKNDEDTEGFGDTLARQKNDSLTLLYKKQNAMGESSRWEIGARSDW